MSLAHAALSLAQSAPVAAPPAAPAQGPGSLLLVLTALSFLPFVILVGTSFVKITVVLGIARSALGTGQVPSNSVITGLAVILSLHVMAPTLAAVTHAAGPALTRAARSDPAQPDGARAWSDAWSQARAPIRRFLRANATPRDRALFFDLARRAHERQHAEPGVVLPAPQPDDLAVLLPAFVISELTSAFAIGFLLLLPLLVVDLVIANLITALGLQGTSPTTVALPFKLLLFLLADGWYLIARALVLGYH